MSDELRAFHSSLITLFNYFKINPLCGRAVLLFGQRVCDDDLQDVLAGRQVGAEVDAPAGPESFQVRLGARVEWHDPSGKDLLAVAEEAHLRLELRSPG